MPLSSEGPTSTRSLRHLPPYAQPLPRLSRPPEDGNGEKYEVVVVGGGPGGLFLTLLLARYGLSDSSLLCIDTNSSEVEYGHADGITGRTIEVLKTLGLADEILNDGCQFCEMVTWNPNGEAGGISRTSRVPFFLAPTRFGTDTITLDQGRVERMLQDDLAKYSKRGIERPCRLIEVKVDEDGDAEFPVVAIIENEGHRRPVRAKHLIGADGAHSVVRQCMGVRMKGDSTDDTWGVIDFVADTDFPDIRRFGNIYNTSGSILQIPRERNSDGHYLTRLYVETGAEAPAPVAAEAQDGEGDESQQANAEEARHEQRKKVTMESILDRAAKIYHPYRLRSKAGTEPEWWAAYQVGQRVAERLAQKDSRGIPRIFLVGDACHTHSPKLGQGMNVSMMDSYDLSWKLIYSLHGLTSNPLGLLESYSADRHENAAMLIDLDKRWYAAKYAGKTAPPEEVQAEMFSFVSGCGVEYNAGLLTKDLAKQEQKEKVRENPIASTDYRSGVLCPGRRIFPVAVTRFADGCPKNLHDDLPSNGRFRIVVFTSSDLLKPDGRSATTLTQICTNTLPQFPAGTVELVALHPLDGHSFEWTDIPGCVKEHAEMRFHNAGAEAYRTLGIDQGKGAVVVVRPDGFVGVVAGLAEVDEVDGYLRNILSVQG